MANIILSLLIFGGTFLSGCSSKPAHPRWLWPPPPEQARLEFIRTFNSEAELLPGSKMRKLAALSAQPAEHEIYFPFGLGVSGEQQLMVADQDKRVLFKYDLKSGKVRRLAGQDQLKGPLDLARRRDETIYLIDKDRVLQLSPQGELLKIIGAGIFRNPAYIEIDEKLNRFYVSDSKANRIEVFNLAGDQLFSFGSKGKKTGEFSGPQGLAIDKRGQIFVADYFNARIQVFSSDGEFIRSFGQRGDGPADFEGPKDLAFDSEGQLHIVDSRKNALLTYTSQGDLLLVTGGGGGTAHPLGFNAPSAIHIDKHDRIYISDRLNHRISIWQYLTPTYLKQYPITTQHLEQLRGFLEGKVSAK